MNKQLIIITAYVHWNEIIRIVSDNLAKVQNNCRHTCNYSKKLHTSMQLV